MVLHKEGVKPYRGFAGVILHESMHLVQPVISVYAEGITGVYLRPHLLFGSGLCGRLGRLVGFRLLRCCRRRGIPRGSRFHAHRAAIRRSRICSRLSRGFSARAMKTGEEEDEAEKQRDRGITGMTRSNNYAILGSDILLPLERVLKFPPLPSGEDRGDEGMPV